MDFELSEPQEILRQTLRRFLAETAPIAPFVRAQIEDQRGHDASLWSGLADLGLLGLLVPEEHGGSGLGMIEMGLACEEAGRALLPGPFAASALAATALLRKVATERERAELLPALANGRTIATLALEEPGGADWRAPRTAAHTSAGGSILVSGLKELVPDALAAGLLLVVARDSSGDLGVFAVDRSAPGVAIAPSPSVDGTRKLGRVELVDAPARRLGRGDARRAVAETVDLARIGLAADALGAATRAHELALGYARERVQFGRPIGSFQAVQHLLVDMLQDIELARAGIYYALWAADAADSAESHRAATMAKAFASARLPAIGANAIQIFGGVGFTWEHDIHLYYKRLVSMQPSLGDEAAQLDELARLVIDENET